MVLIAVMRVGILQVRDLIQNSNPDPSMYGALPPGAWWEVANGELPAVQPYGSAAGDRAIEAARRGRGLELSDVYFAYPARPESGVLQVCGCGCVWGGRGLMHIKHAWMEGGEKLVGEVYIRPLSYFVIHTATLSNGDCCKP